MVAIEERTFSLNAWTKSIVASARTAIRRVGFNVCCEEEESLYDYILQDGKRVHEVIAKPTDPGPVAIIALVDHENKPLEESLHWP